MDDPGITKSQFESDLQGGRGFLQPKGSGAVTTQQERIDAAWKTILENRVGQRTTINPLATNIRFREGVDERSAMSGRKIDSYKPFDQAQSDSKEPIRVVRHGGHDYIMQGNHRVYAAGEDNKKEISVIVYTPDEWKQNTGSSFEPWGTDNPIIK